ncbi:MAG TPA: drug/metabolite exporter YedA [Labilithrix sp.]|jgi:drug/metabolite transporter (DMT)-like permease|nr:drug/metabolite exporter YedA [Labilithrix sp.]
MTTRRLPRRHGTESSTRETLLVAGALFTLYVVWGSTYYAMRVAIALLPPFLMAASRFILAGGLLFVGLRMRGAALPTAKQWASAAVLGALHFVFGNGLVAVAQRTVDSGVAATVVATMPLWAAAIGTAWGDRPTAREVIGLLAGFLGVAVLHRGESLSLHSVDSMALVLAPIAWALGSILSRRLPLPAGSMAAAAQMLTGGAAMLAIAAMRGERPLAAPTFSTVGALVYLVLFGSVLGFTAYAYLLRTTRPSIATSYAYVNPLVALALGALAGGERFTSEKLMACLLTIGGVLVVSAPWKRK